MIDSLCEGCVIALGFGYNYLVGDCTKYVMCFPSVDSSGNQIVTSRIKQCGFGTYWSREKVTCDNYQSTTCATSKLSNQYNKGARIMVFNATFKNLIT